MQIETKTLQHRPAPLAAPLCGIALVFTIGCVGPSSGDVGASAAAAPVPIDAAATSEPVLPILVGVQYALIDSPGRAERVARLVAPLGASAAKPPCSQVEWGQMQRAPGALIDFRRLDGFVRGFQEAGFSELVVCLSSRSQWGSRPATPGRLRPGSPTPRPEHMGAFAAWVATVVERYDGDGVRDMSGLRRPVRIYEVGAGFSSGGTDPPDAYLKLLERAHRAAHGASPDVIIAHAAFLTTGAFSDAPEPAAYPRAFAQVSERVAIRGLSELRQVLDRPDLFDAINLHALGDPEEIDGMLDWLDYETGRRGYEKPVIVSDSAANPLLGWGPATECGEAPHRQALVLSPASEGDRCRLAAHFQALVAGEAAALAWTRTFTASDAVKKVVVAASRDVWLINASLVEDVDWWMSQALEAGAGTAPWAGFLDVRRGELRPGWYALRRLLEGLRGRERVRRVPHDRSDVRLYALEGPAGKAWIGWLDPGRVALPGDPQPAAVVSLTTGSERVRIEPIVTETGRAETAARPLATEAGIASLELTPYPVFVHPY
jgi:hypothetical protein